MALAAGTRLGPYELSELLGAGGMGEVYRARDPRLGRDVAVKVIPTEGEPSGERLRRFETEARAVASLSHPNVLAVFDVGTEDGRPYVVFELLETLRSRMRGGAMPLRGAVQVAVQVCRGLEAAHARGLVHRDLKPENVFVTRDGQVKILDFGLAKLTGAQESLRWWARGLWRRRRSGARIRGYGRSRRQPPNDWTIELDPFPGWKEVPTW